MKITTILFDLDGTLLPMDNDEFTKGYFGMLAAKFVKLGYEKEKLIASVWAGTSVMVRNDGKLSNEEVFWGKFAKAYGARVLEDKPEFQKFYCNEFRDAKKFCGYNAQAVEAVKDLKQQGYRIALATNPIFPAVATEERIRWAGFEPAEFELYTTYENIGFCKPSVKYYEKIITRLGVPPEECLMVGNDVTEDMVAEKLGMDVFLLTDCLINKEHKDISRYNRGSFRSLLNYMNEHKNSTEHSEGGIQ